MLRSMQPMLGGSRRTWGRGGVLRRSGLRQAGYLDDDHVAGLLAAIKRRG